ncbi:PASTA domain-containing protein [Micromonospora echinofusca]|uniref:PASTA domain-containing protein n=1 Tax=Micromonospora echinofusca TaxID=47858 RepID=UPI0033272D34
MTYQPPDDRATWQGQPPPTGQFTYGPPSATPPRRKLGTGAIIGIAAGVVVLACCGITSIAAIVGGDATPETKPSATTVAVAEPASPSVAATVAPTTAAVTPPATATPPVTATAPAEPPAPETVAMPNLKGMNAAVADDKLRKLGFTNVQYGSQDENDTVVLLLANWTVTKQSAKAGTKLAPDDLIVVTCTKQG